MFNARKKDLSILKSIYEKDSFSFLVLYGRRRIGKTTLLKEFTKDKSTIFFSAQLNNDALNLNDFSYCIESYYNGNYFAPFETWEMAFNYIYDEELKLNKLGKKSILIIDEFPYIAKENESIKSILQHFIDHKLKHTNLMLVICGSSISFMVDEVLGSNTPLYGRATNVLRLKEFNYKDSALFFPKYSNIDKAIAYGILGGIPAYLEQFSQNKSLKENILEKVLREGTMLKEESMNFLRQEFREPTIYNSILNAIATGHTKLNEIATKINESTTKCNKYMEILRTLNIIQKKIPCGEKENTKKTIYYITDNYFKFWYHFISSKMNYFDILGDEKSTDYILKDENINDYMGQIFEDICMQYMIEQAKKNMLEFVPSKYGHWWGTDNKTKKQVDIDIMMIDEDNKKLIIGECKFKNELYDNNDFEDFNLKLSVFPNYKIYPYIFIKSKFSTSVKNEAKKKNIKLLTIDDVYT